MADTYLTWWTSIEVDLRKSLLVGARQDTERLHDLLRTAFEAGQSSATPPSPSTAPEVDVRHEFERWMSQRGESAVYIGDGLYSTGAVCDQAEAFAAGIGLARAALASRPAEVDDEGLPGLPKHFGRFNIDGPDGHRIKGYTAEQYRQGQRDAVAADRALLLECKRFLEDMHAMPVEWTIKESQSLHQKLSAPSHTTNKENG